MKSRISGTDYTRFSLLPDGSGTLANGNILWDMSGNAQIAGWSVGAASITGGNATLAASGNLTLGTSNDVVRLSADDATYRLWAGHAAAASAPFSVTKAGVVTMTGGVVQSAVSGARVFLDTTGIKGYNVTPALTFSVLTNGSGTLGINGITWDLAGVVTVAGWTLDVTRIYKSNAILSSTGYVSFGATPPTTYGNNVGAWLGVDTVAKFSLYADANNYFQFSGTALTLKTPTLTINTSGVRIIPYVAGDVFSEDNGFSFGPLSYGNGAGMSVYENGGVRSLFISNITNSSNAGYIYLTSGRDGAEGTLDISRFSVRITGVPLNMNGNAITNATTGAFATGAVDRVAQFSMSRSTGNTYGIVVLSSGGATTNYGMYSETTGATNNYSFWGAQGGFYNRDAGYFGGQLQFGAGGTKGFGFTDASYMYLSTAGGGTGSGLYASTALAGLMLSGNSVLGITPTQATFSAALKLTGIFEIGTPTARGGGNNYMQFKDPTGLTGYMGWIGSSNTFWFYNGLTGGDFTFYTGSGYPLTLNNDLSATFAGPVTVNNTSATAVWFKGALNLGPAVSASIGAGDISVARSATTGYINIGSDGGTYLYRSGSSILVSAGFGATSATATMAVGRAISTAVSLAVAGTGTQGGGSIYQYGIMIDSTFSGTSQTNLHYVGGALAAGLGVVAEVAGMRMDAIYVGAGTTVTTAYGIYISSRSTGTNNYSIYTQGSTPSYFGGTITAAAFSGPLTGNVTGNVSGAAGTAGTANYADRLTTARAIGGTNFDGSAAIEPLRIQYDANNLVQTASWGAYIYAGAKGYYWSVNAFYPDAEAATLGNSSHYWTSTYSANYYGKFNGGTGYSGISKVLTCNAGIDISIAGGIVYAADCQVLPTGQIALSQQVQTLETRIAELETTVARLLTTLDNRR
jgi:hypothetical protein